MNIYVRKKDLNSVSFDFLKKKKKKKNVETIMVENVNNCSEMEDSIKKSEGERIYIGCGACYYPISCDFYRKNFDSTYGYIVNIQSLLTIDFDETFDLRSKYFWKKTVRCLNCKMILSFTEHTLGFGYRDANVENAIKTLTKKDVPDNMKNKKLALLELVQVLNPHKINEEFTPIPYNSVFDE